MLVVTLLPCYFDLMQESDAREVKQMHFISWPDHGVPDHATPLLAFRRKIKAEMAPAVGPTLMHCR